MTIAEGLIAYLGSEATITAIVGTSPKRIYENNAPQSPASFAARPYIVIFADGGERDYSLQGDTGFSLGASLTIECHDDSDDGANDLAESVWDVLSGYSGALGSAAVDSHCELSEPDGAAETPQDGGEPSKFYVSLNCTIHYEHDTPTGV